MFVSKDRHSINCFIAPLVVVTMVEARIRISAPNEDVNELAGPHDIKIGGIRNAQPLDRDI